jgi:hypothetical protein
MIWYDVKYSIIKKELPAISEGVSVRIFKEDRECSMIGMSREKMDNGMEKLRDKTKDMKFHGILALTNEILGCNIRTSVLIWINQLTSPL